jgi:hypothetical protein
LLKPMNVESSADFYEFPKESLGFPKSGTG